MCGICGIVYQDREQAVEQQRLWKMARALRHRGPDDEGIFLDRNVGLAHQRLSIIDLSEQARQPLGNEDGKIQIVFNGEIYNYRELTKQLRQQGHVFRTQSDTEVIVHLYEQYGDDCVQHLNGMFAFAIFDQKKRRIFAARDRFGIKPFYYIHDQKRFAFASEIKAFFAADLLPAERNPAGFSDYLSFQLCLGSKTLFRDVYKLEPGQTMELTNTGDMHIRTYWDLDFSIDGTHTELWFEEELRTLLDDSIRLQLQADVPVGAHLSGGLDSSTISCLAASSMEQPLHTFSGGFREDPKYDETAYAKIVATQAGACYHEVFPGEQELVDYLPDMIHALDEPVAGPGVFPQYCVSELASQHVKVVLGGQGGDEIFGGYTRYLVAYFEECIKGAIEGTQTEDARYVVTFESIAANLRQLNGYQPMLRHFWREGLFAPQDQRYFRLIDRSDGAADLIHPEILGDSRDYDPFAEFQGIFNSGNVGSYINRMTRFDLKTLLPALLQIEDRTSMAWSLESRVPLLDHRIAELVASMPPTVKYKGGVSKYIFRRVVQDIVPEQVYNRHDKMGFPVPLNEWYKREPVRSFVHDLLLGAKARQRGLYDSQKVETLLHEERAYSRVVWGLLSLELWMQAFIDGA